MADCNTCGARFRIGASGWGTETCGECIASRIELELLRQLIGGSARKPMARAVRQSDAQGQPLRTGTG